MLGEPLVATTATGTVVVPPPLAEPPPHAGLVAPLDDTGDTLRPRHAEESRISVNSG